MKAINFPESNCELTPPPGMEAEVHSLFVQKTKIHMTSCWELTDEELFQVLQSKRIYISVLGNRHPPIRPTTELI